MARGAKVDDGAVRVSANGYHYTKVGNKWRLTHHIIAEKKLGRPIREDERVCFIGKKSDLSEDNIEVRQKGTSSNRRRLAYLNARIDELAAERDTLLKEMGEPIKTDAARNTTAFKRV